MPATLRPLVPALLLAALLASIGCNDTQDTNSRLVRTPVTMEKLNYPATRTVDQVDDYHGTSVADPYRWLEDADAAETAAWVEAQNEVTFGFLADIPARKVFESRLTEIWNYERYTAPFREGGRTFYRKNDGLQDQYVLYVQDEPDGEPRVLLDPNTLSEDGTIGLGSYAVSRDGRWLAWSSIVSGSDWRTWYVRDIATGEDLPESVAWSKFSGAAWDAESKGFYYSRYDEPEEGKTFESANYFQKLYYHAVGTSQEQDVLVYHRPDQKEWGFSGEISDDGRFLVINVWQGSAHLNRLYYLDLDREGAEITPLFDEFDAKYTFVGNDGEVFFIQTNNDAPRDRIIAVDLGAPAPADWRVVVAESDMPLDSAKILDHSLVLFYMKDVADIVRVHDMAGKHLRDIELPGLGVVGGFRGRADATETWYVFNSFLNPSEIYHYDFATGKSTLFRAPAIDFDFSDYAVERVFYASKDGTKVPMFTVGRRDLPRDGSNPTILYGYGGFNISEQPSFRITLLPWLEQGGVWAVANIRGGGEYGEDWHQGGILANKQNGFDDFIAAAEFLIAEGVTNPDRLAVFGGSNGGTLVGAVINQRPELFGAAVPAVGVMDMLRFHLFTIGWAWTSDYGSSEDPELFPVLHGYSPYHNLKEGVAYPAVLVTTADHDDRVVPGHSFKYAARLQASQGGDLPTLIRIQTKAGHSAGAPTSMVIQEKADMYAFLYKVLGMGEG